MIRICFKSILLGLLLGLSACGRKADDTAVDSAVNPIEASVESAVTLVQGVADDQSANSYAMKSARSNNIWLMLLEPQAAHAVGCGRAYTQACENGVRAIDYNSCDLPYRSAKLSGQVILTYSDSSCSLELANSTMTRTYDLTFTGPRGGTLSHSSSSASDYRQGASYGGGGQIRNTGSGLELEVLGRHTSLIRNGKQLLNVSTRTLQPVAINKVARNGRIMNGGQIEVNHNLEEFTSIMTPVNLEWSNTCCHPIAGEMQVTYSGSKTGSATISFGGDCGSATVVDQDGQTQQVEFSYCE